MTVRGSFSAKKAGQPMSTYAGQNIYYSALKTKVCASKSGNNLATENRVAVCCRMSWEHEGDAKNEVRA